MSDANKPGDYAAIFNARGHLYNEAGSRCPGARDSERAALIDRLAIEPGCIVCDAPAGGGYLADGVRARWGDAVPVVCVEPAERFGAAINKAFAVHHEPLHAVGLPDHSFDRIGSLAGLHHVADKRPVYREWARLLKPGGRLAVADVEIGTGPAGFLNEFVDAHTPGGHEGLFFAPGEWTNQLAACGFTGIREELVEVPWRFPDEDAMTGFCRTLFAVQTASPEAVRAAIDRYLGCDAEPDGVAMRWRLRYATASAG